MVFIQPARGEGKVLSGPELPSICQYIHLAADSVPATRIPTEKPVEKPLDPEALPIIKEVPKSRRVVKPIAVPTPLPVKPIRIIKPNIITRGLI
ncbi:MAG: hypothetical protein JO154_05775 [Chitinophaga sp.]|uniref:hypothetical protein n=1 Tax=Chitinophaga sp. TaxID=1869181 RepID=UPI0025C34D2C|nr:hypothetical protein [Chitinophaga sp.]MBV8252098.1 hypothetical protein [Chitinophaga sp.]